MLCNIFPTYLLFVRQFPLSKNIYFARIPPSIKKRCQYFYLDARPCDITVRRLRVRLFRFFAYLYSKEQLAIRRLARLLSCCISLSRPAFRFSNKTGGPGNQERKHVHSKIHFKIRFRHQPFAQHKLNQQRHIILLSVDPKSLAKLQINSCCILFGFSLYVS